MATTFRKDKMLVRAELEKDVFFVMVIEFYII